MLKGFLYALPTNKILLFSFSFFPPWSSKEGLAQPGRIFYFGNGDWHCRASREEPDQSAAGKGKDLAEETKPVYSEDYRRHCSLPPEMQKAGECCSHPHKKRRVKLQTELEPIRNLSWRTPQSLTPQERGAPPRRDETRDWLTWDGAQEEEALATIQADKKKTARTLITANSRGLASMIVQSPKLYSLGLYSCTSTG